jgi:LmbE family N-acetylglucosaminyl deacetylase
MNVVSIMAHQDDEARCLGTMLKCQARGDKLHFVTVTDGSGGFVQKPTISREEAARIRHEEMAALAKAVGAGFINLRERDEFLYDTPEVRFKLVEAIRKTRADLIFTHFSEDYNLDHTTVSLLVRHCAMHSCMPLMATPSKPIEGPPAIFMVEPHGAFSFPATHFVDISDTFERKVELLLLHASQEEALQLALGAGMRMLSERLAAFRGEQAGCRYAECFTPMQGRGSVKPYPVLP